MRAVSWVFSVSLFAAPGAVVTFDNGTVGQLPPGWTVAMTHHGAPPQWEIRSDRTARTQPYVFAQVSTDPAENRCPLAILNNLWLRDGDVSVRVKPISGQVDEAGGLVWRYRDENNYYLVRADAHEKNVGVFKVVNGQRIPIPGRGLQGRTQTARHEFAGNAWNILKVSVRGSRFAVYVNHRRLLQVEDATFAGPGKVGLWTRADSVTYFDDFHAEPR